VAGATVGATGGTFPCALNNYTNLQPSYYTFDLSVGYDTGDVRAILLTHAHIDHLGSAIWFASEYGTPVYCHADEVGHAKREYLEQVSILDVALRIWRPRWAVWGVHVVRNGGLIRDGIPSTQPLTAETAARDF